MSDITDPEIERAAALRDEADKLKALWRQARNMLASMFVHLENVHADVGDGGIAVWCDEYVGIPLKALVAYGKCLPPLDAERVRKQFSAALSRRTGEYKGYRYEITRVPHTKKPVKRLYWKGTLHLPNGKKVAWWDADTKGQIEYAIKKYINNMPDPVTEKLRRMTVENGCTPGEAEAAKARLAQIEAGA